MELFKTEYSTTKGIGKLDKVLLNCQGPNYYKLTEFLYISQNEQALVMKALYECNINVVLKFGILEYIQKEYYVSKKLKELPNFIRYFCKIECNDNIKNIINHKETISNYKMCHYGDNKVGIIVMKNYILGSIDDYEWNKNNFNILKNIVIQVIFAILYAYEITGFLHGDLHCGNVLLKSKRSNIVNYGDKILTIFDFEVVIMDFEKSKFEFQKDKITDLFRNIDKFITSIDNVCNKNDYFLNIDKKKIISFKSTLHTEINYYDEIENVINEMYIYN